MVKDPYDILLEIFDAATDAADPYEATLAALPEERPTDRPSGRLVVLGAGKASARMAEAVEARYGEVEGLIVVPKGYEGEVRSVRIAEASHPVPDAKGEAAAREILDIAAGLGADDHLIALISGGGSALLPVPAPGISLADKRGVTEALLASGVPIREINTVRKHLSAIKGGRLAEAAYPAKITTLIVSDIPTDVPALVASGPTLPDTSTHADAVTVFEKYGVEIPPGVKAVLDLDSETPKTGDICFQHASAQIVRRNRHALDAGARRAEKMGFKVRLLGDAIEGEARVVANQHAQIALAARRADQRGLVILSGGETTVTLSKHRSAGSTGGRNSEYMLAMALALKGAREIYAMAFDTDGIDGHGDHAGAIITPDTLKSAAALGLDPTKYLQDNDSAGFFRQLEELIKIGPTGTNVNDFRATLVL